MSAAAIAVAAGTGLQLFGQYQANIAESKAERANQVYYEEQAEISLAASQKEAELFEMESRQFFGDQVNAFVKGGVQLEESTLMQVAFSKAQAIQEKNSILRTGKRRANLELVKAQQHRENAERLKSREYNLLQAVGPVLRGVGQGLNSG